jgi:hypothetical protein
MFDLFFTSEISVFSVLLFFTYCSIRTWVIKEEETKCTQRRVAGGYLSSQFGDLAPLLNISPLVSSL